MGLYPQPNDWLCGPFALKHALIMLGRFVKEEDVARIAGTHWWAGTDEIKLARAARTYQCELRMIRRKTSKRAKRDLVRTLRRGFPSLLCVDRWGHWVTVVGFERDKFILIDSRTAPVVRIETWQSLRKRWGFRVVDHDDPTEMETLYDIHPVIPKFRTRTKAHFSLKRARYLRRPENHAFATHWDEYFTDLTGICTPRTPRSEKVFPLGELLRRHGAMIVSQIAFWHGTAKRRQIERILRNYKFIADTYDLVVRENDEKRTIAAITATLTLWAASKFGVDEVYGNT